LSDSATLTRLGALGIQTYVGHAAAHVIGADAVVTSTAVQADNPEVLAARKRKIPVVPRAMMLAELMRLKQGHRDRRHAWQDHHHQPGGERAGRRRPRPDLRDRRALNSAGANAKLGSGDYIVVEADESDASFLNLMPVMAVVTNIDADHMETYGHDFNKLKAAFLDFLHRMPFYGTAILCTDDAAVRSIVPDVQCPVTTYGLNEEAQVRALDVRAVGSQMHFRVQRRNGVTLPDLEVKLNLVGMHNVLNALSAIAVAVELNIPDDALLKALAEFKGVGRRFQSYGELPVREANGGGKFTVIEDYGHHPVELAATLAAARGAFPGQAHRARVPAASLHAHARLLRGFRQGGGAGRRRVAGRGLSRRRGADRGG
jgi:UDP-N-acetylmuramate--alanine ligase